MLYFGIPSWIAILMTDMIKASFRNYLMSRGQINRHHFISEFSISYALSDLCDDHTTRDKAEEEEALFARTDLVSFKIAFLQPGVHSDISVTSCQSVLWIGLKFAEPKKILHFYCFLRWRIICPRDRR